MEKETWEKNITWKICFTSSRGGAAYGMTQGRWNKGAAAFAHYLKLAQGNREVSDVIFQIWSKYSMATLLFSKHTL
jgi:hypothetical protein